MIELRELQTYILLRQPLLPVSRSSKLGSGLATAIRKQLTRASDTGRIATSPGDIARHVKLFGERDMHPTLATDLRTRRLIGEAFSITGGSKNQARSKDIPHFIRDDGAWFDFTITGRELAGVVWLLAYDFEIRLPPNSGAPFVRFDLNLPGHDNEQDSLRCHVHCGSDDFLLPAPMMTPAELLTVFIEGFRLAENRREPRTAKDHDRVWFENTLQILTSSG